MASYDDFIAAGTVVFVVWGAIRLRRVFDRWWRIGLTLASAAAWGWIGSRAIALAESYYSGKFRGGSALGLSIGAMWGAYWIARVLGASPAITAGALAPGLSLGQAIFKCGCATVGCCYGLTLAEDRWWAARYEPTDVTLIAGTPAGPPLIPVQGLSAMVFFGLSIFLVVLQRASPKRRVDAWRLYFAVVGLTYAILGFLRGDAWIDQRLHLSVTQVIGVVLVLCVVIGSVIGHRRTR